MDVSFVIPVWNEQGNIGELVTRQRQVLRELRLQGEWIVVDGGSEDGTVDEARAAGADVTVQVTPGYGGALRRGFPRTRGTWVVTCDGDGSHEPEYLRGVLIPEATVDVVVFSRYVQGGSASQPLIRRALSRMLNSAFRGYCGVPVRDQSSGYRIYRGSIVRGLNFQAVNFDVLEEILVLLHRQGAAIVEVPFVFRDRGAGTSKVRAGWFAKSYLKTLLRLGGRTRALPRTSPGG